MKYKVVKIVKETYEIEADSKDGVLRKMWDGERTWEPKLVEVIDMEVK